jgi:hypothetical protein
MIALRQLGAGARIQVHLHVQRWVFAIVHKLRRSIITLTNFQKLFFCFVFFQTFCVSYKEEKQIKIKLNSHLKILHKAEKNLRQFLRPIFGFCLIFRFVC